MQTFVIVKEYWHQFDMQWKEAVNTVHIPKPEKWDTFPDQKFGSHSKPGKLSHIPRPRIWVTFPNQGNRATFPDQEFGSHSQTRKPHSQTKNLGHIPKPGTVTFPNQKVTFPNQSYIFRPEMLPTHCIAVQQKDAMSVPILFQTQVEWMYTIEVVTRVLQRW